MEIDVIEQFGKMMDAFGLQMLHLKAPFQETYVFDKGLRRQLYESYDYNASLNQIETYYEEHTLYMVKDTFEESYVGCKIPEHLAQGESNEYLYIGPYIIEPIDDIMGKVFAKNQLPMYQWNDVREYYCGVPLIKSTDILENIIMTQAGYLFGGKEKVMVNRIGNLYGKTPGPGKLNVESDHAISMALIEERYYFEDYMLEAIEQGNLEKAIACSRKFNNYRLLPRHDNLLRDSKNFMIVMNTLCRKAVQRADVHPAHIDTISTNFAKRIESCIYEKDLMELFREMMRKYCLLVRNHSLRGYSKMIQDTMNFIDFNLKEPLSLKLLAEKTTVNPSYLSAQFKKETGKTLTDYINQKRIHNSLILLATTELPIQVVAERVGIYDENYFSRLFKKVQGWTPKQYRSLMKSKI